MLKNIWSLHLFKHKYYLGALTGYYGLRYAPAFFARRDMREKELPLRIPGAKLVIENRELIII